MPTHKWHLPIDPDIGKQLNNLTANQRKMIFNSIRELLEADNPTQVVGVKKLAGRDNQWRQRQGDYRIIFRVEPGEIVIQKFTYKGILHILGIVHRSSAYKK